MHFGITEKLTRDSLGQHTPIIMFFLSRKVSKEIATYSVVERLTCLLIISKLYVICL